MSSVNQVTLLGNLGSDVDKRFTPNGKAVANFRLATHDRWTRDGEKQERTEWHRVVVWGKLAETCSEHLSKGRQVFIQGTLRTRQYDDKDGNKRYTTEIVADTVQFLGTRPQSNPVAVDNTPADDGDAPF